MAGKRQFGSVRKLPSGRWQARYRTADGRLATAPMTFKTKADAARWLSGVEADSELALEAGLAPVVRLADARTAKSGSRGAGTSSR